MSNPENTPITIQFSDSDYNESLEGFGGLTNKLITAANDAAFERFGRCALQNPSCLSLTPDIIMEEIPPIIVVQAWHEATGPSSSSKLQINFFEASLQLRNEDAVLAIKSERDESFRAYPLTTREALVLNSINNLAIAKHSASIHP